jgi:hypothetical protein
MKLTDLTAWAIDERERERDNLPTRVVASGIQLVGGSGMMGG